MAPLRSVVPVRTGSMYFPSCLAVPARLCVALSAVVLLLSLMFAPQASLAASPPPLWECIAGPGLAVTVASNLQSANECVAPLKVYAKDHIVPRICAPYITSGYQINSVWLHSQQNMPDGKQVHYLFEASLLIPRPLGPPMGCVEDYFAVARIQKQTCPIDPLPNPIIPLAEEKAWQFERANGDIFDFENLSSSMQNGVTCMESTAPMIGGTTKRESGYRPPAYQKHLREVWDKNKEIDRKLKTLTDSEKQACSSLITQTKNEMSTHMIRYQPAVNSCHTQMPACGFDMSVWVSSKILVDARIDLAAFACGLTRFDPVGDPTHFQGR